MILMSYSNNPWLALPCALVYRRNPILLLIRHVASMHSTLQELTFLSKNHPESSKGWYISHNYISLNNSGTVIGREKAQGWWCFGGTPRAAGQTALPNGSCLGVDELPTAAPRGEPPTRLRISSPMVRKGTAAYG